MKICSKSSELRSAIKRISPTHIAVAFVGAGWRGYINTDDLQEIIISTGLGSNPKAIEEIMEEIGAKNVYLLDKLHSKIYLGEGSALLGSVNLSDNGFSDAGLWETAVEIDDNESVQQLKELLMRYKKEAKSLYPTETKKFKKLEEMHYSWNKASRFGHVNRANTQEKSPDILKYNSKLDRIHVAWHDEGGAEYDPETIAIAIPESKPYLPDDFFADSMPFLEDDNEVQQGDWLLCWQSKPSDGLPDKRTKISWLFVDDVISGGYRENGSYTKIAAQRESREHVPEPFKLDDDVKDALHKALSDDKFSIFRKDNDNNDWYLPTDKKLTNQLIEYMQTLLRLKKQRKT